MSWLIPSFVLVCLRLDVFFRQQVFLWAGSLDLMVDCSCVLAGLHCIAGSVNLFNVDGQRIVSCLMVANGWASGSRQRCFCSGQWCELVDWYNELLWPINWRQLGKFIASWILSAFSWDFCASQGMLSSTLLWFGLVNASSVKALFCRPMNCCRSFVGWRLLVWLGNHQFGWKFLTWFFA